MNRAISRDALRRSKSGALIMQSCSDFLSPGMIRRHQERRVQSITETLVHVNLLRKAGIITTEMDVTNSGATVQAGQGSGTTEASHDIPCGVRISPIGQKRESINIIELPGLASHGRIQKGIKAAFGRTTILPRMANYVDRMLENNEPFGLITAFLRACRNDIKDSTDSPHADRSLIDKICTDLAHDAYLMYRDVTNRVQSSEFRSPPL